MVDTPLPVFHMCAMDATLWTEWAYVAGVAVCGASLLLRWDLHISLAYLMIRPGDFRLHCCVHKKTQDLLWAKTRIIASYEDLDPRLDDLFLYNADFQHCHVNLCSYGKGEHEEFPSRVSSRVHLFP